jgi:hypothetical protein
MSALAHSVVESDGVGPASGIRGSSMSLVATRESDYVYGSVAVHFRTAQSSYAVSTKVKMGSTSLVNP